MHLVPYVAEFISNISSAADLCQEPESRFLHVQVLTLYTTTVGRCMAFTVGWGRESYRIGCHLFPC